MRHGVVWAATRNLGDDVQTLAAIHLLEAGGHEYDFLEREKLSKYSGPPIRLVVNGWYSHKNNTYHTNGFPPPAQVSPLFIGFHCANPSLISRNAEYLKKHSPVGCRDRFTEELCQRHDIPAYFSGCLTLCFDKVDSERRGCFSVDGDGGGVRMSHLLPFVLRDPLERISLARQVLATYGKARQVNTRRLHVALPSLAMGTKVRFCHGKFDSDPRFSGYRTLLRHGDPKYLIHKESLKSKFKELL